MAGSGINLLVVTLSSASLGAVLALAGVSNAAGPGGERPLDLSAYPTKAEIQSAMATMQAAIPKPATAAPPTEMPGGSVGTAGTYRPADARQPRITRSKTVTLASDGTATFDWSAQGALATPVQVALAPVYSGSGVPSCWPTSATATSVSIKCVVAMTPQNLTLSALTLAATVGVSLNPYTGALTNMQVGVIVLPAS
ncbi:hypothetical protein [Methylobacterium iners]|uniref:Uncharacterized protein n=1 Tax=Methylobacterium iners TaxID=418707 RepID=A0ABQ4RRM5_9HYPH|nr:hypothetical protein [Methylobacterium iners]GJD93369.1 hypothetical protein OCOJLMKI_0563 [Methylobacterium iners]